MTNFEYSFRNKLIVLLPKLRRYALNLTGSVDTSDDLVQATCERVLSRYHQWKPGTCLDRWIFTIMRSIWINELRAQKIRNAGDDSMQAVENLIDAQPGQLERLSSIDIFERAIRRLPEGQRNTLLLVYLEGYSYKETAEILDIAAGTVMSRLGRARQALTEQLEKNL